MIKTAAVAVALALLVATIGYFLYGSTGEMKGSSASEGQLGLEMLSDTSNLRPGEVTDLAFRIRDDAGNIVKDYRINHEKIMHLIVVRKDLQRFQHLHPEFDVQTGAFSTAMIFASDGTYAIFPDFVAGSPGGPRAVTLRKELTVGDVSGYTPLPIGDPSDNSEEVEDYEVKFALDPESPQSNQTTMMTFSIERGGKPVRDLEKYLGALGHAVVLSEGKLEFIHAHPEGEDGLNQSGDVGFNVVFPSQGRYKVFMQFQHDGKVRTVDFVVSVAQAQDEFPGMSSAKHMVH